MDVVNTADELILQIRGLLPSHGTAPFTISNFELKDFSYQEPELMNADGLLLVFLYRTFSPADLHNYIVNSNEYTSLDPISREDFLHTQLSHLKQPSAMIGWQAIQADIAIGMLFRLAGAHRLSPAFLYPGMLDAVNGLIGLNQHCMLYGAISYAFTEGEK
jgi:hypothetical protein